MIRFNVESRRSFRGIELFLEIRMGAAMVNLRLDKHYRNGDEWLKLLNLRTLSSHLVIGANATLIYPANE